MEPELMLGYEAYEGKGLEHGARRVSSWDFAPSRHQSGLPLRFNGKGDPQMPPQTPGLALRLAAKRVIDIVLTVLALIALAPLLVFVAIAVKLSSPGPVLFKQHREGKDGVPFLAFKFRSMPVEVCDYSGVRQITSGDQRLTGVGRFIRRTSIDELPQLLNVLKGDMALIGPRPHIRGMLAGGMQYTDLVPYYDLRTAMRPGLSGWAQVNGLRGPTTDADLAKARIDHDLAYIQNFSLLLDAKIIALTIYREFVKGGSGD